LTILGAAIAATISRWLVLFVLIAVIWIRTWWLRRRRTEASSYALVERGDAPNGMNDPDDELKEDQSSESSEEAPEVTYDEHGFVHTGMISPFSSF
jgi:hypothetical protein